MVLVVILLQTGLDKQTREMERMGVVVQLLLLESHGVRLQRQPMEKAVKIS